MSVQVGTDQKKPADGLYAKAESHKNVSDLHITARPKRKEESKLEEAQLIARLRRGDERALEAIFDLYSSRLFGVAQKIVVEAADAEEVIQDVFLTAFRKAKSFRGAAQLSTWLYRLTVNAALGKIRSSKKRREVEYEEYLPKFEEDGHHLVRPVIDWSETLEERYAQQQIQELLVEALNQLKPVDKSVVVLSDLECLSDRQIATVLNLTLPAVKTRLHRARLFLRGKLAVTLGHSAA